jgi:hypothetical protein
MDNQSSRTEDADDESSRRAESSKLHAKKAVDDLLAAGSANDPDTSTIREENSMIESESCIHCRLVGGPFEGRDEVELRHSVVIRLRAGVDNFHAIYRRPSPDVFTEDGRIVFQFDIIDESPLG